MSRFCPWSFTWGFVTKVTRDRQEIGRIRESVSQKVTTASVGEGHKLTTRAGFGFYRLVQRLPCPFELAAVLLGASSCLGDETAIMVPDVTVGLERLQVQMKLSGYVVHGGVPSR